MARGRFLNRSIRHDKRLNSISIEAEYLFLKCIPHLDRDGITSYDTLWADVMPLRPELMARIPELVQELSAADLVILYDTDEGAALYFTGFGKNQGGMVYKREAPSRFPPPPGYVRGAEGVESITTESRSNRDEVAIVSDETLPKVKVEDQYKDQDQAAAAAAPAAATSSPAFAAWLDNMPGTMTPYYHEQLSGLIDQHGERDVVKAIGIACDRGKRTLSYVRGILERGVDSPPPKRYQTGANNGTHQSDDRDDEEELDPAIVAALAAKRAEGAGVSVQ